MANATKKSVKDAKVSKVKKTAACKTSESSSDQTKKMTFANTTQQKFKLAKERDLPLGLSGKQVSSSGDNKNKVTNKNNRTSMKLVMAVSKGFYGNCKIRRGQKFYIPKKEKLGQWMIPADMELPPEDGFKLHGQASKASPAFLEKPGQLKDDLNRAVFAE